MLAKIEHLAFKNQAGRSKPRSIPKLQDLFAVSLRHSQLATVIPDLLQWIRFEEPADEAMISWLAAKSCHHFSSAVSLWADYCQLAESERANIVSQAKVLPWQTWLSE